MLRQEDSYRIDSKYIPNEFSDEVVDDYATWRYTMVDWFQKIMGTFQYQHETLEVTMSILDRYVAAKPGLMTQSKSYKLAALTSLYVAAKMHEQRCLTPHHVNDLSTEEHSIERIEQEERDILLTLGWKVNPPTPSAIARELFAFIPSDLTKNDEIIGIFKLQMNRMLFEEVFVTEKPSLLVLAGMYNALSSVRREQKLPRYLELRLLSALGLSNGEEIARLRELLLSVSLAKETEGDDEEDSDDDVKEDVEESRPKEESTNCSSPRTIVSTMS